METNVILFFSSVGMVMFLAIGGIVGWIYKETVDASIYAKSGGTVHPEFLMKTVSISMKNYWQSDLWMKTTYLTRRTITDILYTKL